VMGVAGWASGGPAGSEGAEVEIGATGPWSGASVESDGRVREKRTLPCGGVAGGSGAGV
jgi:H+/Cl- antiporter ClcA